MGKVFVGIIAEHDIDGNIKPITMIWPDKRRFDIDRILDIRQAASLKGGGLGTRYICRIVGKEVHLFHDEEKWFIETDKK